jgi:hypothetical protein
MTALGRLLPIRLVDFRPWWSMFKITESDLRWTRTKPRTKPRIFANTTI